MCMQVSANTGSQPTGLLHLSVLVFIIDWGVQADSDVNIVYVEKGKPFNLTCKGNADLDRLIHWEYSFEDIRNWQELCSCYESSNERTTEVLQCPFCKKERAELTQNGRTFSSTLFIRKAKKWYKNKLIRCSVLSGELLEETVVRKYKIALYKKPMSPECIVEIGGEALEICCGSYSVYPDASCEIFAVAEDLEYKNISLLDEGKRSEMQLYKERNICHQFSFSCFVKYAKLPSGRYRFFALMKPKIGDKILNVSVQTNRTKSIYFQRYPSLTLSGISEMLTMCPGQESVNITVMCTFLGQASSIDFRWRFDGNLFEYKGVTFRKKIGRDCEFVSEFSFHPAPKYHEKNISCEVSSQNSSDGTLPMRMKQSAQIRFDWPPEGNPQFLRGDKPVPKWIPSLNLSEGEVEQMSCRAHEALPLAWNVSVTCAVGNESLGQWESVGQSALFSFNVTYTFNNSTCVCSVMDQTGCHNRSTTLHLFVRSYKAKLVSRTDVVRMGYMIFGACGIAVVLVVIFTVFVMFRCYRKSLYRRPDSSYPASVDLYESIDNLMHSRLEPTALEDSYATSFQLHESVDNNRHSRLETATTWEGRYPASFQMCESVDDPMHSILEPAERENNSTTNQMFCYQPQDIPRKCHTKVGTCEDGYLKPHVILMDSNCAVMPKAEEEEEGEEEEEKGEEEEEDEEEEEEVKTRNQKSKIDNEYITPCSPAASVEDVRSSKDDPVRGYFVLEKLKSDDND